ncbi:MAG: DUF3365 domain-containing protein [Proteobacteria bacterium]|nr:DUF3365 domain-containing protein [Pseudomonadota bacterium]MBU1685815.1 DUF3365 domain-containing protein [Pseudomonadota bacterium]
MRLRIKMSLLVSCTVAISFGVTFAKVSSFQHGLVIGQAERQARMLAQQIMLTRKWVADHDGLFLIKKPGVEKNPFLPEGEVRSDDGQVYVKRNPAMVTRELSEYAAHDDFCRFRVTSLKPVNPANSPDAFERSSLQAFEGGRQEALEIKDGASGRVLRFMMPLKVEESCLDCHAIHGYQVGDVRGGLSLEIPISWADETIAANNRILLVAGSLTILITALTIFLLIDTIVVRRLGWLALAMNRFTGGELPQQRLPAGTDEIAGLAGNFRDLAGRLVRSQGELDQTRDQMIQQEKMAAVGRLAAGIAHEINNPLGGMRNCVKSMREAPEDSGMRNRYLELIDTGLQRIGRIVRQLLDFGRKDPLCLREVRIDEVIRECLGLLEYQLKQIKVKLDLRLDQPALVDVEALKQVLVNLALNGIQAMPDGGTLTVFSRYRGGAIEIIFRDTGVGIAPEHLHHIFEPFFTTKEIGQGTGLGLSVSYALVGRMGGEITLDSVPGQGSDFRIVLPPQGA